MIDVDREFFKATASVMSTLLIAVVFTGKVMDNWTLEVCERTSQAEHQNRVAEYFGGVAFVGFLLLTAIVGEGAALAALASSNPRFIYLVLVVVAISFLLTCLGAIVLTRVVSRVEKYDTRRRRVSTISRVPASSSS